MSEPGHTVSETSSNSIGTASAAAASSSSSSEPLPSSSSASSSESSPSSSFSFSSPASAAPVPFSFSFSSSSSYSSFSFGPSSFAQLAAQTTPTDSSTSKEKPDKDKEPEEVEGADSTAEYTPLVKLAEVAHVTGEEDEEVIYQQRAALYRFDDASKEWKERGKGDVKLLKHKEHGRVRILMRQEKTFKACLNHLIFPDLHLKPNVGSDRSWTWRCRDYSSDDPEVLSFAIRFKDSDIAGTFKKAFDEAQQSNSHLPPATSTV